jgi:hypothetical protein
MERVWKCVDIYESAGTLFLQTDQSVSSFPTPTNGSPGGSIGVAAVIPKLVSYTGNTGTDAAVGWVPGRFFSHWLNTYTATGQLVTVWGQVVSIKITVNAGYSAGTFTLGVGGIFVLYKPQNTDHVWNPSIDLTIAGIRTITPSGVTGGGSVWLVSNQITPTITSAVGSGSVQLEILTDQGFPADVTSVSTAFTITHGHARGHTKMIAY